MEQIENKICYCPECEERKNCIHANAFRRLPRNEGGLDLCPKLKKIISSK